MPNGRERAIWSYYFQISINHILVFFPVGKEAGGLVFFFPFWGGRAGWDIFWVVSQKPLFIENFALVGEMFPTQPSKSAIEGLDFIFF